MVDITKEDKEILQAVDLDNRHPHGNIPVTDNLWVSEESDWSPATVAVERNYYDTAYDFTADNYAEIESGLQAGEGLRLEGSLVNEYVESGLEPSPLMLWDDSGPLMRTEFTNDQHFVMYNDDGQMLVDVNLSDGSTIFGDDYTPDETARVFWETIGQVKVTPIEEDLINYEAMQKDLNMYKQLYQENDDILRQVRHNINTPEGENVINYSAQFSAPPGIADDMPLYSEAVLDRMDKETKDYMYDKAMDGLIDG